MRGLGVKFDKVALQDHPDITPLPASLRPVVSPARNGDLEGMYCMSCLANKRFAMCFVL